MERKKPPEKDGPGNSRDAKPAQATQSATGHQRKSSGWQEIEALREKAALKASLADVWDEEFDLDEEILAELDHNEAFFTRQEEVEEEEFDEDEEVDEFFDDDDV